MQTRDTLHVIATCLLHTCEATRRFHLRTRVYTCVNTAGTPVNLYWCLQHEKIECLIETFETHSVHPKDAGGKGIPLQTMGAVCVNQINHPPQNTRCVIKTWVRGFRQICIWIIIKDKKNGSTCRLPMRFFCMCGIPVFM